MPLLEKRTECKGKKFNGMEGSGTINEHMAQNWFRHFKEDDTSLEDKPRPGKRSVVEDEALLEMVENSHTLALVHGRLNFVLHKAL